MNDQVGPLQELEELAKSLSPLKLPKDDVDRLMKGMLELTSLVKSKVKVGWLGLIVWKTVWYDSD